MNPVDFQSDANIALLNPRMAPELAERLKERLTTTEHLKAHVFVLTSGSTAASEADFKWVALSKQAILASAKGSNTFLESDQADIWFHTLPSFHVGGLGIYARAELSGAGISLPTYESWDPQAFTEQVQNNQATLTSLVPTQVFDLVNKRLTCPMSLRAIIVGGGALSARLFQQARALGWPVLPSYGLSETASQAATAEISDNEDLRLLPHIEAGTDDQGRIRLRGPSLFSGYIVDGPHFVDPKDEHGWFTTEDYGIIEGRTLKMTGRLQDRIKIGGELSNLALLRKIFDEEASKAGIMNDFALFAQNDLRLESIIALAITKQEEALQQAVEAFNNRVMPFEFIRQVTFVEGIPKTEIGKVKWKELSELVSKLSDDRRN